MKSLQGVNKAPSFLVKSTKFICLVSTVIVFPFIFINLSQQQYGVAFGAATICVVHGFCAWKCFKDEYSILLSLLGVVPVLSISACYALYSLGTVGAFWAYPTLFVLYFALPISYARLTNIAFLIVMLPIAYTSLPPDVFTRFYLVLSGTSIFIFFCVREIQVQHKMLTDMSITDTLTGLNNRALLDHSLNQAMELNTRNNAPMTLLMIDIDHFKSINDSFGHGEGDRILKEISNIMRSNFRKTDTLFRVGGEEFLVLLNGSNAKNSLMVAERLRQAIADAELLVDSQVTVSIGVRELESHTKWKDWMAECDRLLYRAKELGRNRCAANHEFKQLFDNPLAEA